jgi:hypothetical protein
MTLRLTLLARGASPALAAAGCLCWAAAAAGSLYADPNWGYIFHGDEAYYHDPDGPNPNYLSGSPLNLPGGQAGSPALVFPGYVTPGGEVNVAAAKWLVKGSNWDGSAPGAPLGGVAGSPPPIPPAAPGGVATYTVDGVSYLRIQDPGQPQSWGWADKNAQASTSLPRQEGNNRRIQFHHPIATDASYSGNAAILDSGVTLSFRVRLATAATGPLDQFYSEDGPGATTPQPWPVDGKGYAIANTGRGLFMVTQTGAAGPGQIGFTLIDQDTINFSGLPITKTGLAFNNKTGSPDSGAATPETENVYAIPDAALAEWQEFWVTIAALPAPQADSTHEVKVYANGALEPQTFATILGQQNEFGAGPHLGLGLSSGTGWGAFDVDFIAYKEGVVPPQLRVVRKPGDYTGDGVVDGRDLLEWQRQFNATGTGLTADGSNAAGTGLPDGLVDVHDLAWWGRHFGPPPSGVAVALATPEPGSLLLACNALLLASRRRRPWRVLPAA